MRVFISWSKPRSQKMATILRDWLPEVIQQVTPWVSTEDIGKGMRWSAEIAQQLDATGQGIVCVTRENMGEPWLNFEAGALAKSMASSEVRPVLLGVQPHELTGPLAEFQVTLAEDKADMKKLIGSLNAACDAPLAEDRLKRAFDRAWPDLYEDLTTLASDTRGVARQSETRSAEDLLVEVLERIRGVERALANLVEAREGHAVSKRTSAAQRDIQILVNSILVDESMPVPKWVHLLPGSIELEYLEDVNSEEILQVLSVATDQLRRRGIREIALKKRVKGRVIDKSFAIPPPSTDFPSEIRSGDFHLGG